MLNIRHFCFNPFQERSYVIWDGSLKGAVIDPGFYAEYEKEQLFSFISSRKIEIGSILLTHSHIDHIYGLAPCLKEFGAVKVYMSPEDKFVKDHSAAMARMMGMPVPDISWETEDIYDGQVLHVGDSSLEVISTPGHTPGSVCFYCADRGVLFSGDTLFAQSIGRTDLPGGDYDKIIVSITEKLLSLDGGTLVLPGHGFETTIGDERASNPFLQIG